MRYWLHRHVTDRKHACHVCSWVDNELCLTLKLPWWLQ